MIERFPYEGLGRCEVVVSDGIVYAVATDPSSSESVVAQTRSALAEIDRILATAGSSKAGLLQVMVYLADVKDKAKIDPVWIEWIGPEENWPQRACVGVGLDEGCLIELVVRAKVIQP
ncbi:MAG: RidA family protein [Pseudomonadota bacterium]